MSVFKSKVAKVIYTTLILGTLTFGGYKFYEKNLSTDAFGESVNNYLDTYFPIEKLKY